MFYQLPNVPELISGRAKIPNFCVTLTWEHSRTLYWCHKRNELESSSTTDLVQPHSHAFFFISATCNVPCSLAQIVQSHYCHKTSYDSSNPQWLISVNYSNSSSSSIFHYLLGLFWKCCFMCVFSLPKEISIYLREETFFCLLKNLPQS